MAALPGVYRTAVGYAGGSQPDPTYMAVCGDETFADYVEAVQIDFDPAVVSYAAVLDAFFRVHDATVSHRSRQYSSVIWWHDEAQRKLAASALGEQPRASTTLEAAAPFWAAEPYHQKWLLQRKRPLFLSLGMASVDELIGPSATVLNAVAAGKLPARVARTRLDALLKAREIAPDAHGTVVAVLEAF